MRRILLLVPWIGTWLVWREAQRQRVRFDRLLADLNDIKLERMEVRDSELVMEIARGSLAARLWAGIWIEVLNRADAENFVECKLGASPNAASWVVVTVQRLTGLTPADKLRVAEARIADLERAARS
jgi:hypothetical protein